LEHLPLDILEGICAHLAADLGRLEKLSLFALASTSKRLRSAAARFQFQTITIHFQDESGLRHQVESWRELLGARKPIPYVRRLGIVEETPQEEWDDPNDRVRWPPDIEEDYFEPVPSEVWPLDKDDEFWTRAEPIEFDPWEPVPPPSTKADEQRLWAPVADFIRSLQGLRDVDYQCKRQIPATLLAALKVKDDGTVRLHMYGFSLRSLYQDPSHPHDIDEDEFHLATSPCLSSIRVSVPHHHNRPRGTDHVGRHCFVEDAVAQMVEGLAPNLKSLSVATTYSQRVPRENEAATWSGFFPAQPTNELAQGRGKGALQTLALESGVQVDPDTIRAWNSRTDFTTLRSLHLHGQPLAVPTLNVLSEISEAAGLRSLSSLSLWTTSFWRDDLENVHDDCKIADVELARFLRTVPSLQSLELKGTFASETFGAILHSHGSSIQKLRLLPERDREIQPDPFVLTRERIETLVEVCPNIRDLELLVPRSKGDEEEARIYRALAGFPLLDRLSLFLDCSNIRAVEMAEQGSNGSSGAADKPDPIICDAIINLNTSDRALATDIFDAICLHRSPRLIRLYPAEAGNFGTDIREWSMLFIRNCLSRAWIRQRDDRAGHAGEYHITEVVAKDKRNSEGEPLKSEYYIALESIWPGAAWRRGIGGIDEMKSFPLWKPPSEARSEVEQAQRLPLRYRQL
jgi:hypothetical protein